MSGDPHAVAIRDAGSRDAEAVAAVLCRALQAAYLGTGQPEPRRRLAALEPDDLVGGARAVVARAAPHDWTVVAEADGAVVGFQRLRTQPTPDGQAHGEIASLYVDPPAWGAGGGGRLLDHGLAALGDRGCGRAWLWVAAENGRAQRFYRRHGFAPDGARRTYPMRAWGVDLGFALDVVRYARGLPAEPDRPPGRASQLPTQPDHTEKTDRRHTGGRTSDGPSTPQAAVERLAPDGRDRRPRAAARRL